MYRAPGAFYDLFLCDRPGMHPELFAVCFAGVDVLGWSLLLWHVLLCFVLHRK